MITRFKAAVVIAGALGTLAIGPAAAQPIEGGLTILYEYYYYSDYQRTDLVGTAYDDCSGYHLSGTSTQYPLVREIGECVDGVEYYPYYVPPVNPWPFDFGAE